MYVSYDDSAIKAERRVYVVVPRSSAWRRSIEHPATPGPTPFILTELLPPVCMYYRNPENL